MIRNSFTKQTKSVNVFTDLELDEKINKIEKTIESFINEKDFKYKKICIFCIGTDRSIPDSIGPFVGTFLKENYILPENVDMNKNYNAFCYNQSDCNECSLKINGFFERYRGLNCHQVYDLVKLNQKFLKENKGRK